LCGCDSLTSGRAYWQEGKGWEYPVYLPGHHTRRRFHHPTGARKDRCGLKSYPFISVVERKLKARRWTYRRLQQEIGVSWECVLARDVPRAEYVLRVADVLGLDRSEALALAGQRAPSPIGWKILDLLVAGMSRDEVAQLLDVDKPAVSSWLTHPDKLLGEERLRRIGPRLGLAAEEIDALIATARRVELNARKKAGKTKSALYRAGILKPNLDPERLWQEDRQKMVKANKKAALKAGRTRRFEISREWLAEQFAAGKSLKEIGKEANCSVGTVLNRSYEMGLRNGIPAQEHWKRQRKRKQTAPARDARARQVSPSRLAVERAVAQLREEGEPPTFANVWRASGVPESSVSRWLPRVLGDSNEATDNH
jgi:DNA-binding CsgD family transcriptional regulator